MRERKMWRLMVLCAVIALTGCSISGLVGGDDDDEKEVDANGVVEFVGVEGGCWSIRSGNEVYEPIDLPEGMKIEGLAVEFEGEVRSDLSSTCQIGPMIELEKIERASDS
jgi:hypothetical protein